VALRTEVVTSGVFLLGMGAGMYGAFCPSFYEVSSPRFSGQTETSDLQLTRLRRGEIYASVVILTVGAGLSVLHRNMLPFFVAVFLVAAFVVGYEYLLDWNGA
jgi:hypothetical protein